jgi:hypothetical protein
VYADPVAHLRVTVDTLISRGPVLLWGWAFYGSVADTTVTFRDGQNVSGPITLSLNSAAGAHNSVGLSRPLLFRNGIFADVDAGLTALTVMYEPLREEQLIPRVEQLAETE